MIYIAGSKMPGEDPGNGYHEERMMSRKKIRGDKPQIRSIKFPEVLSGLIFFYPV
jgi:hypothetical protein